MENASEKIAELIAAFLEPQRQQAQAWVDGYRKEGWSYADIYKKLAGIIGQVIKERGH